MPGVIYDPILDRLRWSDATVSSAGAITYFIGGYDASGGTYPSTGGTGGGGAILKGNLWNVTVAGVLPTGQSVQVGDTLLALVDSPGQTQSNWGINQTNINMSALGDTIYGGAGGAVARLAGNTTTNQLFLSQTGDGVNSGAPSWQPIPAQGALFYYFTPTASSVVGYKQQTPAPYTPQTALPFTAVTNGEQLVDFITNANFPNLTFIAGGLFQVNIHAAKGAGTRTIQFYAEIWETDASGVDIAKIGTTGNTSQLTAVNTDLYATFVLSSEYTLASASSRIDVRIFAVVSTSGTAPDINIYVGGASDSHLTFPSSQVDATNFVPYTGATKDLTTAFNIALSSQTASTIAGFDGSKNIVSLSTSTYPSLTELSYVKGVTSAIQTQIDGKQATLVSGTNIKTINSSSILGSGDLSVGLTNWTEAVNSAAPNATIPVVSLTVTNAASNVDAVIAPKGSGGFALSVADGTSTGGNKRGRYSADLQTSRSAATQVAGDDYSILAGINNRQSGGGAYNAEFGNTNVQSGCLSSFNIGDANTQTSTTSSIVAGSHISQSAPYSAAFGYGHTSSGGSATLLSGQGHTSSGSYTSIMGRYGNDFANKVRNVQSCDNDTLTAGSSQKSTWVLFAKTTGTGSVIMTSDATGTSASNNQINLQDNNAVYLQGTIIGKKSGTSDVAVFTVVVRIYRGTGAASVTLTGSTVTTVENTPAFGVPTLTADTTNGGLAIGVSGVSATNIRWVFQGTTTEVIY